MPSVSRRIVVEILSKTKTYEVLFKKSSACDIHTNISQKYFSAGLIIINSRSDNRRKLKKGIRTSIIINHVSSFSSSIGSFLRENDDVTQINPPVVKLLI